MRQHDDPWPRAHVVPPAADDFSQARSFWNRTAEPSQMIGLRVGANRQNALDPGHCDENLVVPLHPAFAARRQVAAGGVVAGEAEAHGEHGDGAAIVEGDGVEAHPVAQAIAGGVGEGQTGGVDAGSRRLPGDEDARLGR